jgi:hypothetical protein
MYGLFPTSPDQEWPMVGWLISSDEGERRTHQLGERFTIADRDDAGLRIAGMAGVCEIAKGGDGFQIEARDGASVVVNGKRVTTFPLIDNDRVEIGGRELVFKSTM